MKHKLLILMLGSLIGSASCSKSKSTAESAPEKAPLLRASLGDGPDVDAAKGLLRPAFIQARNKSLDNVKLPLQLAKRGPNGVTIEWLTNKADVIDTLTGEIKRPSLGSDDTKVRVTASLTKGTVRDSKSFEVTVKSYKLEELGFETVFHGTGQSTEFPSTGGNAALATGTQILIGTHLGLAKSSDAGNTWGLSTIENNLAANSVNFIAAGGNTVFAGSYGFNSSVSLDGGSTFKTVLSSLWGTSQITDAFVDGSTVYVITSFGLYKSIDGALSWTAVPIVGVTGSGFLKIHVSGSTIFLGTYEGLSISNNNGTSWTNLDNTNGIGGNSTKVVTGIAKLGNKYYVSTQDGLSVSTDSGATWSRKSTAQGLLDNSVSSICVNGTGIYVSYGWDAYGISWSTNDGTSFTSRNTGTAATYIQGIACTDSLVYGVGQYRVISAAVSSHTFGTVSPNSRFSEGTSVAINSSRVFATTRTKTYVSAIDSNTFSEASAAGGAFWVGANDSTVYFGTNTGGLLQSNDNGATVARVAGTFPGGIVESGKVTDQVVLAGTLSSGLGASSNQGSTFSSFGAAQGLASNQILGVEAAGNKWFIATANGLNISANNGSTWATYNQSNGIPSAEVTCVAMLGTALFVGTSAGGAFSFNEGLKFEAFGSERGLGNNSINNCGSQDKALFAGSDYGFAISVNAGKKFQNFTYRDGLPGNAITAFAVAGGNIYVMTPEGLAGSTWTEGL